MWRRVDFVMESSMKHWNDWNVSVRRSTLSRWVNPSSPLFGVWLDFHAPCTEGQKRICQVLRVPFWKPTQFRYPLPHPLWFLDDFWCSTPSFTRWTSVIHFRFSQVWLDSYFPSYKPQLLAQLEDYLEIRKLQWLDEVTASCGNMGARNQPTNLFQFIYIDT